MNRGHRHIVPLNHRHRRRRWRSGANMNSNNVDEDLETAFEYRQNTEKLKRDIVDYLAKKNRQARLDEADGDNEGKLHFPTDSLQSAQSMQEKEMVDRAQKLIEEMRHTDKSDDNKKTVVEKDLEYLGGSAKDELNMVDEMLADLDAIMATIENQMNVSKAVADLIEKQFPSEEASIKQHTENI